MIARNVIKLQGWDFAGQAYNPSYSRGLSRSQSEFTAYLGNLLKPFIKFSLGA